MQYLQVDFEKLQRQNVKLYMTDNRTARRANYINGVFLNVTWADQKQGKHHFNGILVTYPQFGGSESLILATRGTQI